MKTAYQRHVSPLERVFVLLAEIDQPFSNQIVLEGTGTFDVPRWEAAVAAACEANPGSRVIYKGWSRWAKWVDTGTAAPVRLCDGARWSGNDPEGASFLDDPLPFRRSHSCEVLLVRGDPPRVIFRTLHAVMDGGGTLQWVYDIFRALRGEALTGAASTISDAELMARLGYPAQKKPKPATCLAPTGAMNGEAGGRAWKRVRVPGTFSKLLPQVALAIAREARRHGPGDVVLNVPFDLRLRVPGLQSTANLSRRIVLNVPPEATMDSLQEQIRYQLENPSADPKLTRLIYYLPLGWMKHLFNRIRQRNLNSGRYHTTGSISNMGRLRMELLQGGGFESRTVFCVPPGTEAKPFFMVLNGCGESMEMTVSMPKALASNSRLDHFMAHIADALKPRP